MIYSFGINTDLQIDTNSTPYPGAECIMLPRRFPGQRHINHAALQNGWGHTFWSFVIERPILGDHPKALISWFQWNLVNFMWNLADFVADHMKSTWKPYKSNNSRKTLQFCGVQWKGYVSWFYMKSAGFHEIHWILREIRRISWNLQRKTNCQEW